MDACVDQKVGKRTFTWSLGSQHERSSIRRDVDRSGANLDGPGLLSALLSSVHDSCNQIVHLLV